MQTADTAPVRTGEELDAGALSDYLKGKIPGAESGITLEQFPGGHSNLTYLVLCGGVEYVLRRAPHGPVPPKAHDMAREYGVLKAIHPHFEAAPKPYLLCEDAGVIGAVFYLMERRRGVVLRSDIPVEWRTDDVPARVSSAFLDCLVALHSVDVVNTGIVNLGKPSGFVERQVRGWTDRWLRAKTEELPEADRVVEYLRSNIPADGPPTIVHNDFKLDNLMLDANDPGRVEAVLDWEMTTVGDPLVDLGLTLCYWAPPDAAVREGPVPCLTDGPGWMTRDELIRGYAGRTGRDMSALPFHEILGIFKLAVIVQQIFYRWFKGQTNDARFANFDVRVKSLIKAAADRRGGTGLSTLYLVRHGQAGSRGDYDTLSEVGQRQAALLGAYLASERIPITTILSGQLQRQQRTAAALRDAFVIAGNGTPEIRVDPLWSEFDLDGVYNGIAPQLACDDAEFRVAYEALQQEVANLASPIHRRWSACDIAVVRAWIEGRYSYGGETWIEFNERIRDAWKSVAQSDSDVIVSTSATPIAISMGLAMELAPRYVMRVAGVLHNASITSFRIRNGDVSLFGFNQIPHLPDPALRTFR